MEKEIANKAERNIEQIEREAEKRPLTQEEMALIQGGGIGGNLTPGGVGH